MTFMDGVIVTDLVVLLVVGGLGLFPTPKTSYLLRIPEWRYKRRWLRLRAWEAQHPLTPREP